MLSPTADRILKDGDRAVAGTVSLEVMHTPGHTPGSICLLGEGVLFSGDTLFRDGVGRTDFPGGDCSQLCDSLAAKIFALSDCIRVCPGHGPETSIGRERRFPVDTDIEVLYNIVVCSARFFLAANRRRRSH